MTLQAQVAGNFNIDRLIARLTVAFGAVALLLACLGLYGVTAYSVTRRTREIGIRMAVGASRQQVLTTVLKSALLQVAIGVAIGVPAVFGAARLLRSTLFGVSENDPLVLTTALAVLGLSAVIAALIPARRAATMDPVKALRVE
jgi:ABC-type antimicrobial peptide transport system permease subunit